MLLDLYHRAIQQYFQCGPDAYEVFVAPHTCGLPFTYQGNHYRVEGYADRVRYAQDLLSSRGDAEFIPREWADVLMEDVLTEPGFLRQLFNVLSEWPGKEQEAKNTLALAVAVYQLRDEGLWAAVDEIDPALLPAVWVAWGQLYPPDERDSAAESLAQYYFAHGQDYLCEAQDGLFAQVQVGMANLVIYETDVYEQVAPGQ